MTFLKSKLLAFVLCLYAATSAFAATTYDISVDTSSFNGTDGYLYLQYIPVDAVNSTATVSGFATDGMLGAQSLNVVNGNAVTGTLPGAIVFANTNGINDYNHAITFGTTLNFNLLFDSTPGAPSYGTSTFSLGLFADEWGMNPLVTTDSGTLLSVDLHNDGTTSVQIYDGVSATANPVPVPAAAWLLGSGLIGLVGIGKKRSNN